MKHSMVGGEGILHGTWNIVCPVVQEYYMKHSMSGGAGILHET